MAESLATTDEGRTDIVRVVDCVKGLSEHVMYCACYMSFILHIYFIYHETVFQHLPQCGPDELALASWEEVHQGCGTQHCSYILAEWLWESI